MQTFAYKMFFNYKSQNLYEIKPSVFAVAKKCRENFVFTKKLKICALEGNLLILELLVRCLSIISVDFG